MRPDLSMISERFRIGNYVISRHADEEMQAENIILQFLEEAIGHDRPRIIETYEKSCLILGWSSTQKPVHAVVALGTRDHVYDTPILVTVYRPDYFPEKWSKNYAKRKKKQV